MSVGTIWVLAEATDGALASITLEMLAKARQLSDSVALVYGGDPAAIAAEAGDHGASTVLGTGDLGAALLAPSLSSALAGQIEAGNAPAAILAGTTYDGRDVASRLSVKIDAPVITNIVDLEANDGLVGTEPVFGGTQLVKTRFNTDKTPIFLIRPKSFAAEAVGGDAASVQTIEVGDLGATGAAVVTETFVEQSDGPKLDEAAVVVAGGRGLGQSESFEMIESLAKALGGAAGASRAIVDAGWVPYSYQIGQTGKVVKPDVYIAAGISGATQHLVGMKGSKHIIAINKDEEAPIFGVADLGIVGDVHKVLPKLLEALQG